MAEDSAARGPEDLLHRPNASSVSSPISDSLPAKFKTKKKKRIEFNKLTLPCRLFYSHYDASIPNDTSAHIFQNIVNAIAHFIQNAFSWDNSLITSAPQSKPKTW